MAEAPCWRSASVSVGAGILGLLLALPSLAQATEPEELESLDASLLVGYSFETDEDLATGPDTFRVYQNAKGSVRLSPHFRTSGYHAVEVRDFPADGNFPELQGYFPERQEGRLYAHFALLLTDPAEELNIALAGPSGFGLRRDGLFFWLSTLNGNLVHYSDSMPKRLFEARPFVWYLVDVSLDLDAGSYDLRVTEEGVEEALVDLENQPNAPNQPRSAVDKYSFIGDRGQDTSAVLYYVDDVFLAVAGEAELPAFIAPGRRRLFIDSLDPFRQPAGTATCPPPLTLADFGGGAASARLSAADRRAWLETLTGAPAAEPLVAETSVQVPSVLVEAASHWRLGCQALDRGRVDEAVNLLGEAVEDAPESRLIEASYLVALARAERWSEVDEWLAWLEGEWWEDPRFAVVAAAVAELRGDLDEALSWIEPAADYPAPSAALLARLWTPGDRRSLLLALRQETPQNWQELLRQALAPTQYFYLLLVRGEADHASQYADSVASHLEGHTEAQALWAERAADAAFHAGDVEEALGRYESLLDNAQRDASPTAISRLLLKLSDVQYRLGDLSAEQELREKVYGRLVPQGPTER